MLTLLIAAVVFDFPGGSVAELAWYASQNAGAPVAILANGTDKLRAAKFSWEEKDDFRREMRSYFAFIPDARPAYGFSTRTFPAWSVVGEAAPVKSTGVITTKEGKVSAGDEKGAAIVYPSGMDMLGLGNIHWFLKRLPVAVAAKEAEVADVRDAVLIALGADKSLQPIPKVLHDRLIAGFDAAAKEAKDVPTQLRLTLTAATYRGMSDDDVVELYQNPTRAKQIVAKPGTAIFRQGWTLARALVQTNAKTAGPPPVIGNPEQVDPQQAIRIELKPREAATVQLFDERGRPAMRF